MEGPPHFSEWQPPEVPVVATASVTIENTLNRFAAANYAQAAAAGYHQHSAPPPVLLSRQPATLPYIIPSHAPRKDWGSELEKHIVQYGTEYERQQHQLVQQKELQQHHHHHQQQLLLQQHQQHLLLQQQEQIDQQHKQAQLQEQIKYQQGQLEQEESQQQIAQEVPSSEISQLLPCRQHSNQILQQPRDPVHLKDSHVTIVCNVPPKQQPHKKQPKVTEPKAQRCLGERKAFKKLVRKQLYQTGKQYVDGKGKFHPPRQVKQACEVTCKYSCPTKVMENQRTELLKEFWDLSKEGKFEFIINTTSNERKVKKRRKDARERRHQSYKYYFVANGKRERVCKKFYLNTLDISQERVYNVHRKLDIGQGMPVLIDNRGHTNPRKVPAADRIFAKVHIESYPKLPATVKISLKNQAELEGVGIYSVAKMYRFYIEKCKALNINPVKLAIYRSVYKESMNPNNPVTGPKLISDSRYVEFTEKQTMMLSDLDDKQVEKACRECFPIIPSEYIRTPKSRKQSKKEGTWKRVVRREMYQAGQQYIDYKGKVKPQRQVKPACFPECKYHCSDKVPVQFRHSTHHHFWILSKSGKANFLADTTEFIGGVKKRRRETKERRHKSYKYFFHVNSNRVRVCKKFYLSTLDISQARVYNVHQKQQESSGTNADGDKPWKASITVYVDKRGKASKILEEDKHFAKTHIESFPPVPTQCVRVTSKNKEFLESIGVQSVSKMYNFYKAKCGLEGREPVNLAQYRLIRNSSLATRLLPYIEETKRENNLDANN